MGGADSSCNNWPVPSSCYDQALWDVDSIWIRHNRVTKSKGRLGHLACSNKNTCMQWVFVNNTATTYVGNTFSPPYVLRNMSGTQSQNSPAVPLTFTESVPCAMNDLKSIC